MKLLLSTLLVTTAFHTYVFAANSNCTDEFKKLNSPILASHLFDTGDYSAVETGDWSNTLKTYCEIKETMMIRYIAKGVGMSEETVECIKYEVLSAEQKQEFEMLYKNAKSEKLTNSPSLEGAKYVTTIAYPNSSKELVLSALTDGFALESKSRKGPASEQLTELIVGMCAFAK